MATDWSDNIVITELSDEPALSEELSGISQRISEGLTKGGDHVPHVVLNFAAVSYVNSSNLAQLLRLRKQLAEHKRLLKICSVKDDLWSVFLITGLDKVFRFAPDPMTALAGIQIESGDSAS
jgi:anti-anti-sigma factor